MTYQETIEFLYSRLPSYERQGNGGYKPGLQTAHELDELFGSPHRNYRIIHVGGTNGKGSVSHLLAALLQLNGYRVGLYTSPHITDFRERIKVNGKMIGEDEVVAFMETYYNNAYDGRPSFFELTTEMAFDYFAKREVDVAIVEVGLGGRLDSTNIVTPILSIITNISLDHTYLLGNSLPDIATEKAGIIKPETPVVIGECTDDEVRQVFVSKANAGHSPICFADSEPEIIETTYQTNGALYVKTRSSGVFESQLTGTYQIANLNTWLCAVKNLRALNIEIKDATIAQAAQTVCSLTGFMGRWTVLSHSPTVVCDAAHNLDGLKMLKQCLATMRYSRLHFIYGVCADKDLEDILPELPQDALYYFTQADNHRALPTEQLKALAQKHNLVGEHFGDVETAFKTVMRQANPDDLILVAGSIYLLADFLKIFNKSIFISDN